MATKSTSSKHVLPLVWVVIAIILLVSMICWWKWRAMTVATGPCQTQNLQATAGQQSGAAGTIYQHMVFTNKGTSPCTISGYPTAFLYGSNGYALGAGAAPSQQTAPTVITLAPDASAYTVLGYPQAGNFPPGICSANTSVSVKLYPPSGTTTLDIPLEVAYCPGFSITALQPGS